MVRKNSLQATKKISLLSLKILSFSPTILLIFLFYIKKKKKNSPTSHVSLFTSSCITSQFALAYHPSLKLMENYAKKKPSMETLEELWAFFSLPCVFQQFKQTFLIHCWITHEREKNTHNSFNASIEKSSARNRAKFESIFM